MDAPPPAPLVSGQSQSELWHFARHRRGRWLNNRVEQDHRRIKRLTRPMLGFQGFWTAKRTLAGIEATVMLAKGQVHAVPRGDHAGAAILCTPDLRPYGLSGTKLSSSTPFTINATDPMAWQKTTEYGRRALAETTIGRYKAIIGPKLRARS